MSPSSRKTPRGLIYLYCVTKTKPQANKFEEIDIKIYPLYFQGLYAIVSRVSPDEFSEDNFKKNLTNINWVEEKARQHEKIIEEIMRHRTVMPFKFGTVFETEKNVLTLLKGHITEFREIIENLNQKEEWGIKIYCDLERFKNIIGREDERVKEKEKELASSSKGKAYFLKKRKESLIDNIINQKISEYTQDSFNRLKKVSVDARINKILPKKVTEKKEDMVLNTAFLIKKKRVEEFSKIVRLLKTAYSDRGLIFDCTGPWPPYNFCETQTYGAKRRRISRIR